MVSCNPDQGTALYVSVCNAIAVSAKAGAWEVTRIVPLCGRNEARTDLSGPTLVL